MEEKGKMLEQTKMFIANITSENCSLQNEVVTLNRILSESGAGDMLKQMEQMELFKLELDKVKWFLLLPSELPISVNSNRLKMKIWI